MKNAKLDKAKAGLVIDQPFFASLLLGMKLVENPSIPTMATDGEVIYFNPAFIETLSLPELTGVLAHETLHCVFQHMFRRGERNPNQWNIAADYVINEIIMQEKAANPLWSVDLPEGHLRDPNLYAEGGGTAEGIYKLLPADTQDKKPGDQGGALDDLYEPGTMPEPGQGNQPGMPRNAPDQATMSQKQADMRVRIIQAHNAAKMQGNVSAGIERLVEELTRVETDWRTILRRFFSERAKTDLSYAKPKRRFLADDIYLPSLIGEKLGMIDIAVDCSGSVDKEQLERFGAEINAIVEDTKPAGVRVIYFDAEVLRVETFGPDEKVVLKPIGGGGTDFAPIFNYIYNEPDRLPVACVVLTDLLGSFGKYTPDFPVLWASVYREHGTVPFGEVTYLKVD